MNSRAVVLMLSGLWLVSCGGTSAEISLADARPAPVRADWKQVVTPKDMDRLRTWRTAFVSSLEAARIRGNGESIDREGSLLHPDAALSGPKPPSGNYRCRVIKIGSKSPHRPAYVVYPGFACVISDEGEVMSFSKLAGSQRPVGLIFPGDEKKQIFLGTMVLGDEGRPMDYGRDATRDMAGALERIGENRWRLLLPYPHFESILDVIELIPQSAS